MGREAGECNCLGIVGTSGAVWIVMFQCSGPFLGSYFLISKRAQEYKLDFLAKAGACF